VAAGRLELEAIPFDLRALAERVRASLEPRARNQGIALRLAVAADVPALVVGDPGRLRQVLSNLVANAVKFTSRGGVDLEIARDSGTDDLVFVVRDTGIGIAPEALRRIFEPFAQGGEDTARLYGGSGLGLAVANGLVGRMGGRIEVHSRVRRGTRFTFRLALPAAPDAAALPAAADLQGLRLLLVLADDTRRDLMAAWARGWGAECRSETAAEPALRILRAEAAAARPFDVAMIARELRPGDGEALGGRIASEPALGATRLVLLAESGLRGDAARAEALGFDAYLSGGPDAPTLLDCLRRLRARARRGPDAAPLITVHSLSDARLRPLRLLVVDDNAVNRRLMRMVLERAGHAVQEATDGAAAFEAARAGGFHAVLMDVQMPGLDGVAASRRIRGLRGRAGRVPILAVTANPLDDGRYRSAGMDAILAQPLDRVALLTMVERLVMENASRSSG
jgi:CheY-like chemotaxis protein/anti-sigma regulatory factor (Ser/Thr protein kinase)